MSGRVVARIARQGQWPSGHDKEPTSKVSEIEYQGIMISTRYAKQDEIDIMKRSIDLLRRVALGSAALANTTSIFCDSKASDAYLVSTRIRTAYEGERIGRLWEYAIVAEGGGHNGISVDSCTGTRLADLCPQW